MAKRMPKRRKPTRGGARLGCDFRTINELLTRITSSQQFHSCHDTINLVLLLWLQLRSQVVSSCYVMETLRLKGRCRLNLEINNRCVIHFTVSSWIPHDSATAAGDLTALRGGRPATSVFRHRSARGSTILRDGTDASTRHIHSSG